jgi:RHS repeat-associated protein
MRWFEPGWRHSAARISAVGLGLLALAAPARADDTVDPTSGKLAVTVVDIAVSGGAVNLPVTRSLGSGDGAFGAAWSSNWDAHLVKSGNAMVLYQGSATVNFAADGNQYKAEGGATITGFNGGYAIHRADLVTDYFDAQGRWMQRSYDNGYAAVLKYDAGGRLTGIDGPLGGSLVFTLDNAGHVTRIASSNGDAATYTYQGNALVAVTEADGTQLRYTYDGSQIARIEDSASGAETFSYDKSGRVTARQWADGTAERWEYDDQAQRARLIAPGGAVTTWTLGADGALEQIDPLDAKTVTRYDAQGRVASTTSADGKTSHMSYDAQGRLSKVAEDGGITTDIAYSGTTALISTIERSDGVKEALQYDRGGKLTQVTVNGETVAAMTYNDSGQIASRKSRGSPIERYEYDGSDWLAATVDANGQRTRYTRDPHGRVLSVTDPTGGVTTYAYDALGRIVSETTPTGGVWGNEYNQAGQLVARIAPDGARETYQYDARGQRIAVTDASGRRAELAFDPAQALITQRNIDGTQHRRRLNPLGQVIESQDATGRVVRYDYGAGGVLAAEHRPDGQVLVYHYDEANRLIAIDDGLGGRTRYAWAGPFMIGMADASNAVTLFDNDAQGRVTTITDPLGGVRHIAYGEGNSPVEVKTAGGDDARYTYDAADRLMAVQDPAGGVTKFERDAAGRITAIARPDGTVTRFAYDKAGGRIATADGSGRTVNYSYDPNGRLSGKKLPDGTSVGYRYGTGGTLTDADDKRTPVHRTLDAAGRVTAIEWPSISKSLSFAYDATGSVAKLTGSAGQVVQYRYDNLHRLAAIALPAGGEIGLSYDAAGRLAELRYPNGTTGIYRYGRTGAVEGLAWTRGSEVLAAWTYNHDAAGNVGTIARANAAPLIYGYDADGRLIEEKVGATTTATYAYLPGGDRAKATSGNQSVAYTYDKGRLASAGGESFAYGPLGEITERSSAAGKTSYQYDAEGHLLRASLPSGAAVSFAYDGNGTRVARSDAQGTTHYLSDDENLIEEIGPSGASVAFYVYGPGTDRPLAMIRGGQAYFYHADAQGTVALLTDAQGKVAARYETDAFGRPTAALPPLANPFIFAGREYDAALGLYYFRARYYDASLGRFISADPMLGELRDPATLNRYAYALNAPTRFTDPTGLAPRLLPRPTYAQGTPDFVSHDGTPMQIRDFQNSPPPDMRLDFDYWQKKGFSRGQLLDLVNQARRNILNHPEYVPGYGGKPPSGAQLDADAHWLVDRALGTTQIYEPDGAPTTQYVVQALNRPQRMPGWISERAVPLQPPPGGEPSANPGGSSGSVSRAIEPGPAPGASSSAGANNSVVANAGSNPAASASASGSSGSHSGISLVDDALKPNPGSSVAPVNPVSGSPAVDPSSAIGRDNRFGVNWLERNPPSSGGPPVNVSSASSNSGSQSGINFIDNSGSGSSAVNPSSASSNSGSQSGINFIDNSNSGSGGSPVNPPSGGGVHPGPNNPNVLSMPNLSASSGSNSQSLSTPGAGGSGASSQSLSTPGAGGSGAATAEAGSAAGSGGSASAPNLAKAPTVPNGMPQPGVVPEPNPGAVGAKAPTLPYGMPPAEPLPVKTPGNLLNGGAATSSTAIPPSPSTPAEVMARLKAAGPTALRAGVAGSVVGGTIQGIDCALDGGNAGDCAKAAGKGAFYGGVGSAGAVLLTAAAPAVAPVLAAAGTAAGLYSGYNLAGKAANVWAHGTIKDQEARSQAVLRTEDRAIARLQEKINAITQLVASVRDAMTAIQELEGTLDKLTAPKAGGDFSTADQLRRAADELTQICAKLSDDLGKINGATSSAAGTIKQIADLMAAPGEPPESTPGVTSAAKQLQALQGTLTGTVAQAAAPIPALVTQIKADFQGLGGSNGPDTNAINAIKAQIAKYDALINQLPGTIARIKDMLSEFDVAKVDIVSGVTSLRENVRLDAIGASNNDLLLYDAKAQTLRRMEPGAGNIADEALALLKRAEGNLKRWRNAIGGDSKGAKAQPFDIKTACSIGPEIQSVTNAVAAAGTALKDLSGRIDALNGTFQRRKPALDKIAQIDNDALTKGPGLVAIFKKANQPDNASAAQAEIDRANQRQAQLPREQAAVQQAVTSLGTIKSNVAGIVSTLGGGQ